MATYISLDNLARYDMKAKARAEGLYADASAACWQKTEKAGAVTCVPAPETPLEPVVEFLFKETLPEGMKEQGNPSTIEGVSSIECSCGGKNLLYYPLDTLTKTIDGVTFTYSSDGSFSASGTSAHNPVMYRIAYSTANKSAYSYIPAGTYTLSGCPANGNWGTTALVLINSNGNALTDNLGNTVIDYGSGRTFTIDEPKRIFCMMRLGYAVGTNISGIVYKPQLEIGSSVTALEPANRSKLPISLPSTFYGGTLDVASGRLTVTHRMVEPSSGTVDISDRPALLPLEYTDTYGRTVTSDGNTLSVGSSGGQIVYRLANPYTVYVDPVQIDSLPALDKTSPRINTIYTDAENVQVGYAEHPAYTEELINNAILALGGNI